jgi:predicted O-methyltransferase YrrM
MSLWRRLRSSPGAHYFGWRMGLRAAQTQTTPAEQECLARHASGRMRLLEIGVWHGVNTRLLRSVMATDGVLYAVDPFPTGRFGLSWERLVAHGEVGRSNNGEVRFLEMTSVDAARRFGELVSDPLDFAFIDGEHSFEGLQCDWTHWAGAIAPGGIVALHDSRSSDARPIDHVGSVRYTQQHILSDTRFRVVDEVDSLTVLECQA